jgi:hypothetical protein
MRPAARAVNGAARAQLGRADLRYCRRRGERMRTNSSFLLSLGALLLLLVSRPARAQPDLAPPEPVCKSPSETIAPGGIYLGVYTGPEMGFGQPPGEIDLPTFETHVGRKFKVIGRSIAISAKFTNERVSGWASDKLADHRIPLFVWNLFTKDVACDDAGYADDKVKYSAANIARGDFDDYFRQWGQDLDAWLKTEVARNHDPRIVLRPFHETNQIELLYKFSDGKAPKGTANPNCDPDFERPQSARLVVVTGKMVFGHFREEGRKVASDYDAYKKAWRHLVALVQSKIDAANVDKVWWMWSMGATASPRTDGGHGQIIPLADIYPGDDCTTIVAMDCYNACLNYPLGGNINNAIFFQFHKQLRSVSQRPIFLGEVGYKDVGDHATKTTRLKEYFDPLKLKAKWPFNTHHILGFMYWNQLGGRFAIEPRKENKDAFRIAIQDSAVYIGAP